MAMSISRMLDQNSYYFLVSGLRHGSPEWININFTPGYPRDIVSLSLPSASIYRGSNIFRDFELGTSRVDRNERYIINLFCSSDGQRDDLAEQVREIFDGAKKDFLDFNQGFSGGQASLGIIHFDFLNMKVFRNTESEMRANKYRMDIEINAQYIYDF